MNLPKSPKTAKSSPKSPTMTKEGKEDDPLAGIEDLVEDLPDKAPEEEEPKEEIIEDVDASSFDLNPDEEAELAQALEKGPGDAKKSAEIPAEVLIKTPENTPEPMIAEGGEEPAESAGEGAEELGEGEKAPVETTDEQLEESVPAPDAAPAPVGTVAEGTQPAETGTVPPSLAEAGSGSAGEEGGVEEPAPVSAKEIKFATEPLAIEKALDEKSFVKAQIEAALFVSDKPVSTEDLSIKLEARKTLCAEMLKELMMDYMDRVTSLEIVKVGEDTYTMQIRPEYTSKVKKFASGGLIPEGVMRTLTIIALKQPITKSLLVKLRGSGAYEHVKDLEDRGLVRSERAGRTQNVTTTDQFADMFGLSREIKKMKMQLKAQLGVKEEDEKEDTTPKAPPPVPEG